MKSLRLFIAINLSSAFANLLEKQIIELKQRWPTVKWTKTSNLHFTLAFLGTVHEEQVAQLLAGIRQTIVKQRPFSIKLGEVDFFPNPKHPNIVWLKVEQGYQEMEHLAKQIRLYLHHEQVNYDEKPFKPHLTVARVKTGQVIPSIKDMALGEQIKNESMLVDRLLLVRSQLDDAGVRYTSLGEAKFSV